jgi:hypothetical protein
MIEACLKRSAASKSGGKVFFSLQATSSGRLAVIAPAVPYRGSSLVTERLLELNPGEVDFANKQITLPASRVKNGREHTIPLSSQA